MESVTAFYDGLSGDYHLLFDDWPRGVRWQGGVIDRLLRDQLGDQPLSVLDCCCGIGTQAIGLALLGHRVHATDLSAQAVERAAREARALGASLTFGVADVRTLAGVDGVFDAVIACDNSLPHLLTDEDLRRAVGEMAAKLRPGGLFLATTRDYDTLAKERPIATPLRVLAGPPRRVVFQVWDWTTDGRAYRVHQLILKEAGDGWETAHHATEYRALLRDELAEAMRQAGLGEARWHAPEESGYYQPVVTARKP